MVGRDTGAPDWTPVPQRRGSTQNMERGIPRGMVAASSQGRGSNSEAAAEGTEIEAENSRAVVAPVPLTTGCSSYRSVQGTSG